MPDLQAIRARCEAASWPHWSARNEWGPGGVLDQEGKPIAFCGEGDQAVADARFIAHAREDVPALLAEVERLASMKHDARYWALIAVLEAVAIIVLLLIGAGDCRG